MIDLRIGDCIERMKEMEDNSIDFIVCDPPYHLTSITKRFGKKGSAPATTKNNDGSFSRLSKGFMGKDWDGTDENGTGIAFNTEMWKEAYRILKPNGYCLAFSGTRTYHRMAKAIEEAEFEIQGISDYTYGSGFPKALSIDKALDKLLGAERKVVGQQLQHNIKNKELFQGKGEFITLDITAPSSDIAKQYEGYKTQIKPSREPIVVAKKKSNTNNIDFLPFIYCAKASKKERNGDIYGNVIEGLNNHPTVKPLKIIQELFKQAIDKEEMVVLDMFAGSGTTGVAIEKFNIENGTNHKCILIEKEKEYAEIIKKRCCLEEV